ncbi:MAG: serine phosphatase RsbU (regulator of sigma subunit) [Crocinitomicaceae bacterium]
MKKYLVILLLLQASLAEAQTNIDSLWGVWNDISLPDSARLNSIHVITRERYVFAKPDSAFILAKKQYDLAKKVGDKRWMAEGKNTQAISLHIQGNYNEAIDYYNEAISIAEENDNKKSLAGSLNNVGIIYKDQGNNAMALEYFERSLKIKREIDDLNGIANSLGNLGSVNLIERNYDKALGLFNRGLAIHLRTGNKRGISGFYNEKGLTYLGLKDLDSAQFYFNKSLEIRDQIVDKKGSANCLANLALVYNERKEYKEALVFGNKALRIAQQSSAIIEESQAARALYESHNALGNHEEALRMHELYLLTKDSIGNESSLEKILQFDYRVKYEKRHLADSVRNAEKEKVSKAENRSNKLLAKKKSDQAFYLFGLLFIAILFGIFIFNRFRITQKQKAIIVDQKQEVDLAYKELDVKNKEILDSINYAKRIQTAMLPSDKAFKEYLQDSFILYKPKDIVAGDFYWMEAKNGVVLFAVADCTGHGVPGAMVSVVCNNGLNRAVREFALTKPGEILDRTRELVVREFDRSQTNMQDGMDIALCRIEGMVLHYSGAYNSLWIIRDHELIELKADKQPIGKSDNAKPFTTQEFELKKGDSLYAATDGYVDQFGGKDDKKLKSKNFKEFLMTIQGESMQVQKTKIDQKFEAWRGDAEQVDDVCIIGVNI